METKGSLKEEPFSVYVEARRAHEEHFMRRLKEWKENYREPGTEFRLSDLRRTDAQAPTITSLWDLVDVCTEFVITDGISLALMFRAEKRSLQQAGDSLDRAINKDLLEFVYEEAWEPISELPGALKKWKSFEAIASYRTRKDLHVILTHGRRQGISEKEIVAQLTQTATKLKTRQQKQEVYRAFADVVDL